MSDEKSAVRSPRDAHLDEQYRKIGISAVAAALRYQGDGKNPAYARTVDAEDDPRFPAEAA